MDMFEKFNAKFGKWYEGLFGGDAGELRPKDVLRKIIAAMEDNRKEGFDAKIYVPNKYVLELAVADAEERDYLLSFLDEDELTQVLQRFMAQNKYHTRGPLEFTIADVPETERETRREKLRVKARFEKGELIVPPPPPVSAGGPHPPAPSPRIGRGGAEKLSASALNPRPVLGEGGPQGRVRAAFPSDEDLPTIPAVGAHWDDEPGTIPAVAWGKLTLTSPGGQTSAFALTKPIVTIGRSRAAGNDIVLDGDGMVSKAHARLERDENGQWIIYDLNSTNGVRIDGARIGENAEIGDGDVIAIGGTQIVFSVQLDEPARPASQNNVRRPKLIGPDEISHVLASETLVGRAITSDIVLNDARVSMKHARLVSPDALTCYIEDLGGENGTLLNGRPLAPRTRALLADGDTLSLGGVILRFVGGQE